MEKEDFLQQVKDNLEAAGYTANDFILFCLAGNEIVADEGEFPFAVMYEGMIQSKVPLEGKKPLGVIFDNCLIAFHLYTLLILPSRLDYSTACVEYK